MYSYFWETFVAITDANALIKEVERQLAESQLRSLSPEERRLHEIAQMLLRLERDMRVPGAFQSTETRVERLLEGIAKENF